MASAVFEEEDAAVGWGGEGAEVGEEVGGVGGGAEAHCLEDCGVAVRGRGGEREEGGLGVEGGRVVGWVEG